MDICQLAIQSKSVTVDKFVNEAKTVLPFPDSEAAVVAKQELKVFTTIHAWLLQL